MKRKIYNALMIGAACLALTGCAEKTSEEVANPIFEPQTEMGESKDSAQNTNTENNDNSMIELQKTLSGKGGNASRPEDPQNRPLPGQENALKLSQYFVVTGHDTNVYWVFDVGNSTDAGDSGDEG